MIVETCGIEAATAFTFASIALFSVACGRVEHLSFVSYPNGDLTAVAALCYTTGAFANKAVENMSRTLDRRTTRSAFLH